MKLTKAKGHDYITLFVDLKEKKTLHISDGKGNETVIDESQNIRKKERSEMASEQ